MTRTEQPRDQLLCLIPPLFGEANRMRRLLVSVMRHLADVHQIASILPDLPGTMDSETPLAQVVFGDWQQALIAAGSQCGPISHSAAIRAGAALDAVFSDIPRWRLSPTAPAQQLRTLARAEIATLREDGKAAPALSDILTRGRAYGLTLAGYAMRPDMIAALMDHSSLNDKADRIIRLAGDSKLADAVLQGPPLWLRAEPGDAPELAEAIAADIARWMSKGGAG